MLRQKLFGFFVVILGLLLVSACNQAAEVTPSLSDAAASLPVTDTLIPPTLTETLFPSTSTPLRPTRIPTRTQVPTRTPQLASSASDIMGTWLGIETAAGMYIRFQEDGVCQQSRLRSTIDTNPDVRCTYYFEGTNLYIDMILSPDSPLPPCQVNSIIYQVVILGRDQIEFISVSDPCIERRETMQMIHEVRLK